MLSIFSFTRHTLLMCEFPSRAVPRRIARRLHSRRPTRHLSSSPRRSTWHSSHVPLVLMMRRLGRSQQRLARRLHRQCAAPPVPTPSPRESPKNLVTQKRNPSLHQLNRGFGFVLPADVMDYRWEYCRTRWRSIVRAETIGGHLPLDLASLFPNAFLIKWPSLFRLDRTDEIFIKANREFISCSRLSRRSELNAFTVDTLNDSGRRICRS